MTQLDLYKFFSNTKGEGIKDVNTMLNTNFEIIRQLLNIQDLIVTELETTHGVTPEDEEETEITI